MVAITRRGLYGGPRSPYGSFAGKTAAGVPADAQVFLRPRQISQIRDDPRPIPFENGAGQTLEIGDVFCWTISEDNRKVAAVPSTSNIYNVGGVVFLSDVEDGNLGWGGIGGRPLNVKVTGGAGVTANTPLKLVAGQTYLEPVTAPVEGLVYPFVLQQSHTSTDVVLKRVLVRLPH